MMIGDASLAVGRNIEEGSRQQGRVMKIHQDSVFISLGGPDEGVLPLLQFNDMPKVDDIVDCLVRSFNSEDGLYELALPGEATTVDDWSDIQEGIVVEATVESSNTGGLECKVGGVRGFIPMRQISEFRVEDVSGYIGKRLMCVVLEANPQRGNLVLSHRAILERERQEKRTERLANLEVGQATDGIVRKIMDFGAFIDIGGLDGLLHISQLSYERVKHPSEILKEGDKIQVRVEKIDPETGKIGLSYRSLQEHPWANIESQFPIGAMVKGPVTRIANFGAFVRLATGVEGLIHVSELAHRRIANVSTVVQEGQEVEVKILTVDRENQRIGLSLKAAQPMPEPESTSSVPEVSEADEPPRTPAVKKHQGPLKGGAGSNTVGGERFGLKW
jgi:small subunit ribosomal protein S1